MSMGPMELVIILVIVLVLFGAGKLPRVMNDVGKGIRSMKEGLQGKDDDKKIVDVKLEESSQKIADNTETKV